MNNQNFTIWDYAQEPIVNAEVIYRWNGYAEGDFVYSLLRYVDINSERLRSKYLAFTYDLGEKYIKNKRLTEYLSVGDDFSLWWMSLLVEKSPFKSPRIIDCLRLFAVEEILLDKQPASIKLVSADKELAEAIKIMCKNYDIKLQWDIKKLSKKEFTVKNFYRKLPTTFQALIYVFYYFISRAFLRKNGLASLHREPGTIIFLSYFFNLGNKLASKGEFYSNQWGALPNFLHENGLKSNYVHHYLNSPDIPNIHIAKNLISLFNKNKDKQDAHAFVDSFLKWHLIFVVLYKWLKLNLVAFVKLRKVYRDFLPKNSKISLWPLLRQDWRASIYGSTAIQNLIWLELFDVIMKSIPYQRLGFYLCENQGWERAFINKWRKYNHGQLIGVAHSTVRYWDLRYYYDRRTLKSIGGDSIPLPDKYALNGNIAWTAFVNSGFDSKMLIKVEALRYQYLNSKNSVNTENLDSDNNVAILKNNKQSKNVLILGDFTTTQTHKMLACINEAMPLFKDNMIFTLKPHPLCELDLSAYSALSIKVTAKQLSDILDDVDVVFSSNITSAGLDAYLKGLPTVVLLDDESLNFSPLRGTSDVDFVSNSRELAVALQTHRRKKNVDLQNYFWLDPGLLKWKKIIIR